MTHTPGPTYLCADCKPTKIGTRGRAVALCPVHAQAPALLAFAELARSYGALYVIHAEGQISRDTHPNLASAVYALSRLAEEARAILRAVEGEP